MIVAPLMTPILGIALAVVCADLAQPRAGRAARPRRSGHRRRDRLARRPARAGRRIAATNSQVASRVAPRLIDLVAAVATGAVGAFAVVRSDVSDTLPGVAIAISLVPPLAVVGLTLESHHPTVDRSAAALRDERRGDPVERSGRDGALPRRRRRARRGGALAARQPRRGGRGGRRGRGPCGAARRRLEEPDRERRAAAVGRPGRRPALGGGSQLVGRQRRHRLGRRRRAHGRPAPDSAGEVVSGGPRRTRTALRRRPAELVRYVRADLPGS